MMRIYLISTSCVFTAEKKLLNCDPKVSTKRYTRRNIHGQMLSRWSFSDEAALVNQMSQGFYSSTPGLSFDIRES